MSKPGKSDTTPTRPVVASAAHTIEVEVGGLRALLAALEGRLGDAMERAVDLLDGASGRIIVSGMGKSGQIARKVASTLASTGTPAIYIHPGEASHGDLGMIANDDVMMLFSWSGETRELKDLIAYSRRFEVPLIAVTARGDSALARAADIALQLPVHEEACPNGLAPTTSTTMQLATGDALAVALLEKKGFSVQDFKVLHPGGKLGAALAYVGDIMHTGSDLPLANQDMPMSEALVIMTEKSFGCLGVIDNNGALTGIITDGDLRRNMSAGLIDARAGDIMTPDPVVIDGGALASSALDLLNKSAITATFVVENGKPVGVIHLHDLLRIGVA